MGDLKLTSASGSVTLSPENVAGTTTITLPSSTATLATNENFTSTGIDDNATSTAITIDSSENVGIGTGSPTSPLHVLASSAGQTVAKFESNQAGAVAVEIDADADRDSFLRFQEAGTTRWAFYAQGSSGTNELNLRNQSDTNLIQFKQDGRGLSQFTAKAWVNITDSTQTIANSHNISSVSDDGTGKGTINFANTMVNSNYAVATHTEDGSGFNDDPTINRDSTQARSTTAFGYYTFRNSALDDAAKTSFIFYGD